MSDGRVAIIGCGRWGQHLLRDFVTLVGAQRVVACDTADQARAAVRRAHPDVEVREDPHSVFADDRVHAVVVATEVSAHYPVALAALRAGKHVLVEKPLARTVEEAEALRTTALDAGVILTVDHLLLTDPAIQKLERMLARGVLGDLLHVHARRTNLGVVRTEENALWSLAPHDVAVMLRLFGAPPVRVEAAGAAWLQPERHVEDSVFAALEFPPEHGRPRLGHLHASWLDPLKARTLTFVGSEAMAVFDDGGGSARLRLYRRSAGLGEDGRPFVRDDGAEVVPLPGEPPLLRMCRAFLDCLDGRGPNPSDAGLGVEVVRVLARLQASLDARRAGATA